MFTEVRIADKLKEVEQAYLKQRKGMQVQLVLKRLLDVAIASIAILILLPVFLAIALLVRLSSPGPILFRQERLGKLGTTFTIYKFRTMVDGAVNIGAGLNTFKGDPRITPVGKFLREYHLDELPQLFNVLKGDMSLVGPRPLLPLELPKYSDRQKRRLLVSPGITAWEAVNGGLDNTREQRIELDLWYVDRWNFWIDLLILARTIPVVLRKEGVYAKAPSSQTSD
ncbi:MAG: sugar transferase [Fischerella sp.]|jgi:lipopolysaccharide/colanic/teichoic acid biosynthesis glycosyltransferase|uniref:sugar transferase n=1 Tax=Fischerella sp. TaxID=1191 RepID=UPI0017CFE064|nr:sugar transferase [Fischerella sp.]NWF58826.1 sugar transferase [Fischerella sp.]